MRRSFVEVDDAGVVVEIHNVETKGNKGDLAKEPKNAISKKKPSHKVEPNGQCNKGDKWNAKHGTFLRELVKR